MDRKIKIKAVISDFDDTMFNASTIEHLFATKANSPERKHLFRLGSELALADGFRELMNTLRDKGIPFSILTNNRKDFLNHMCKVHNLDCFDLNTRLGHFAKYPCRFVPKHIRLQETYDLLLQQYPDLKREEILYIGDSANDAAETKMFGGMSGACMWFCRQKETLLDSEHVDYVFEKPLDVLKLVA